MITGEMMRRAWEASENRDYSKPAYDQIRDLLKAALEETDAPEIEVTDEMIKAGLSAYKFAQGRSLSFGTTIEDVLAHLYRSMAKKDPSRRGI